MKVYTSYSEIKNQLQPGDVMACIGNSKFCNLIKGVTGSLVSHLGIVSFIEPNPTQPWNTVVHVTEAGLINGFDGVSTSNMAERVSDYLGEVFVLRLRKDVRDKFNAWQFYDWIRKQDHKPYDVKSCLALGLLENDWMDSEAVSKLIEPALSVAKGISKDDPEASFFCSELVAGALKAANIIPDCDPSEMSPKDVCMLDIYEPVYYQLSGNPRFNVDCFTSDKNGL